MHKRLCLGFYLGLATGIFFFPIIWITIHIYFFLDKSLPDFINSFFDRWVNTFTSLGYISIIFTFLFTIKQILDAKKRSIATMSYKTRKDSREILSSIPDELLYYIEGKDIPQHRIDLNKFRANRKIHEILMQYAAIYDQWVRDNYDDTVFRKVVLKEIRFFIAKPRVNQYWKRNIVGRNLWTEDFIKIVDNNIL